jgi:short-subunit dehydrogenase
MKRSIPEIQTALITGASSGLGASFARQLAREGYRLILTSRRQESMQNLKMELVANHGSEIAIIQADLSVDAERMRLCAEVDAMAWPVDVLINNAGFGTHGYFHTANERSQSDMIQVNILALTMLTRHFAGAMIERNRGAILNVASVAAFQPGPMMAVYFATKAYVLSFSEALSEELRGSGVVVTALCPGPTESEFMSVSGMEKARLIKGRKLPGADPVVELGLRALRRGKRRVIHGTLNRIQSALSILMPRTLVLRVTHFLQKQA